MSSLRPFLTLVQKEIRIELRSKELFLSAAFFSLLTVLLFAFAFVDGGSLSPQLQAGILWLVLFFCGVLCVHRSFLREREENTLEAVLLTPTPAITIYAAKVVSVLLLLGMVLLFLLPLLLLFLHFRIASFGVFSLILFLGLFGFAALASVFALPLGQKQSGALLLSIFVYPLLVPTLIAGVKGTFYVLCDSTVSSMQCQNHWMEPGVNAELGRWIKFLGVFDIFTLLISAWLVKPLSAKE